MGNSQSSSSPKCSNSRDYRPEIRYYPNFDSSPLRDQDFVIIEQKHFCQILRGDYPVWIYFCALKNEEGAKIGATVLGSVAGVAGVLSFVPVISERSMHTVIPLEFT